ncbi:carbonic anhydrase [Nocardiopsis ansamitocini]|uniref:carbonic anhydrase n=1 Tax=Nocardiopsis ansamitocini TaxID=1670832 RepID=A0A9W6UIN6_9ACTN|nr:carbonic anhydrase [Nocardiopsis ansamitocini]GLU50116.1 carbonic anhydrase [Nocardiopsis ansamitocini]
MAISRRTALRASIVSGTGLLFGGAATAAAAAPLAPVHAPDADAALKLLKQGNRRWRRFEQKHPNEGARRRGQVLSGQNPFALVLGCADSRVPAELVFDRGLGDLFSIRSAGQVLDESVLGSISYGVEHLHIPLIVVLGHAGCGAVTAAVETHRGGELPEGHIGYLVEQILPVVDATPDDGEDFVDACVSANALHIAETLRFDPDLVGHVDSGELRVVAARYELDSSEVRFLD